MFDWEMSMVLTNHEVIKYTNKSERGVRYRELLVIIIETAVY